MKIQLILISCASCLVLPVFAQDKEDTPLGKQMDAFNSAYKAFRKETDMAKGATQARDAQQAVIKGLGEIPAMLAKVPDGPAKAKAAAEFRKMMGKALVTLCEIEEAFLSGKADDVAKGVATLKEMKKAGHDKFIEEE
jgi:soluble cytochrome b562